MNHKRPGLPILVARAFQLFFDVYFPGNDSLVCLIRIKQRPLVLEYGSVAVILVNNGHAIIGKR